MKKYLEKVNDQVNDLQVKFVQIPREENKHADRFAKAASTEFRKLLDETNNLLPEGWRVAWR